MNVKNALWLCFVIGLFSPGCVSPTGSSQDASPSTPVILSPSVTPYFSPDSIIILGECTTGLVVSLVPSDATDASLIQTTPCSNSAFSFSVIRSIDGTYDFSIFQTRAGRNSKSAKLTWTRNSAEPPAPVITTPIQSPQYSTTDITIAGTCTEGLTVNLTGADTQTQGCESGTFSFPVTSPGDGTFTYYISQVSLAGLVSNSLTQIWTRDNSPAPPPTITSPASPYYSSSTISITGGCSTGMTVNLTGSDTQIVVCNNSAYSFLVSKSVDGTYNFNVSQTTLAGITSSTVSQQWIRESDNPEHANISSFPPAVNVTTSGSFEFASPDPILAGYKCKLDTGSLTPCTSPQTYTGLTNGSHTFTVVAVDQATNEDSSPPSYTWTQAVYNTVALYHLDSANPTLDSGNYPTPLKNSLTNNATSNNNTAPFNQGRSFSSPSNMYVAHNTTHGLLSSAMSIEVFARPSTLAANSTSQVLVSKDGGTSGTQGWQFGYTRIGTLYYLYFSGSGDGTTAPSVALSPAAVTFVTTAYHHYAMTWNAGSVTFYYDGTKVNGSSVTLPGVTSLFTPSTTNLILGSAGATRYYVGSMDEVRISKTVRWNANFTPPAAPYTAD